MSLPPDTATPLTITIGGGDQQLALPVALALCGAGFATRRLKLRGGGPGRLLAGANDAARSDRDFESVPERVIPLAAVSLCLAGTTLLSACLARLSGLAALACLSTPFDLAGCSAASGRPHKAFSQRWLVRRLRQQSLAGPFSDRGRAMRPVRSPRAPHDPRIRCVHHCPPLR